MCRSNRVTDAILGLLLIFAFLAAPVGAFAKDYMIADDDYSGGMQPGDPEGGDRVHDDSPYNDPYGGNNRFVIGDIDGDDSSSDEVLYVVIPILRDVLIIVRTPDSVTKNSILLSR